MVAAIDQKTGKIRMFGILCIDGNYVIVENPAPEIFQMREAEKRALDVIYMFLVRQNLLEYSDETTTYLSLN